MDVRIERMARVLANYSLGVQPGEWIVIRAQPVAEPLLKALYKEILTAGGHPQLVVEPPWQMHTFHLYGSDDQLDFVSPLEYLQVDRMDGYIEVLSENNIRALSNVSPPRIQRRSRARTDLRQRFDDRSAEGTLRWVLTLYPTEAYAQGAEMSLEEYQDFVYRAALVDSDDPVTRWEEMAARQRQLTAWLEGRNEVHIRGADVDLRLSVKGRIIATAAGRTNFPDGEIYVAPLEESANGWVRFTYPATIQGREVSGIEFTFEKGRIVKATASRNEDALLALLDTDAGARYLGELGIGTNPGVNRFTHNILFDEKIQGTFHLAVGSSADGTDGVNHCAIHEDIVCDLKEGEITVDGDLFYRNGDFVVS
ncbi:MAG TPA: aminopeptidase [Ardenticatenaceae bacterium]|jgi:aminopeptidase